MSRCHHLMGDDSCAFELLPLSLGKVKSEDTAGTSRYFILGTQEAGRDKGRNPPGINFLVTSKVPPEPANNRVNPLIGESDM